MHRVDDALLYFGKYNILINIGKFKDNVILSYIFIKLVLCSFRIWKQILRFPLTIEVRMVNKIPNMV